MNGNYKNVILGIILRILLIIIGQLFLLPTQKELLKKKDIFVIMKIG